jgi:hypothetical protein
MPCCWRIGGICPDRRTDAAGLARSPRGYESPELPCPDMPRAQCEPGQLTPD